MVILSKEERAKVLDKLEKLLAHTGSGGVNVSEMSIANRKIKELTDEYGISLDELKGIKDKGSLIEKIDVNVFYHIPKMWVRSLSATIAKFYDCRVIRSKGHFYFIGFKLDAEIAADVFERLKGVINGASRIQSVNMNDFSYGVVISLRERLDEIKREREKVGVGGALVVVKENTVNEQFRKMFPNTIKEKGGKYHHGEDFIKGIKYGKTVEIFKSVKEGM